MNLHDEARIKGIIRPIPPARGRTYPPWVNAQSARWVRPRLVQIRRYLAMELGYGMGWDESDEGWEHVEIRTLLNDDGELIGCAAFDLEDHPVLAFVWLHPFYRGRSILQSVWPGLRSRFGEFEIERPVSPAMRRFLSKQPAQ